jgi:hypothetical protein
MSLKTLSIAAGLIVCISLAGPKPCAKAGFHLWQVKEVFTNASGSVQFVEMFDSFSGEVFTGGFTLTANSDGNIKTFTFPSNISSTPGSMLIATTGFGSLSGGVTPDFTSTKAALAVHSSTPTPRTYPLLSVAPATLWHLRALLFPRTGSIR